METLIVRMDNFPVVLTGIRLMLMADMLTNMDSKILMRSIYNEILLLTFTSLGSYWRPQLQSLLHLKEFQYYYRY